MKKIPGKDGGQAASLLRRCVVAVFAFCIPLVASDYLTEGNDPGRTGWMKDEKVFTLANVKDRHRSRRTRPHKAPAGCGAHQGSSTQ
jgi:hypothetical protein